MVPNVTYYYIKREDSATNKKLNEEQNINQYIGVLVRGFEYLEKFFNQNAFFEQRTDLKYILFNFFTQPMLGRFDKIYKNSPCYIFDPFFRKEISSEKHTALTAFIMNMVALYRFRLSQNQNYLFAMNQNLKQAQKRIAELENEIRRLKGIN